MYCVLTCVGAAKSNALENCSSQFDVTVRSLTGQVAHDMGNTGADGRLRPLCQEVHGLLERRRAPGRDSRTVDTCRRRAVKADPVLAPAGGRVRRPATQASSAHISRPDTQPRWAANGTSGEMAPPRERPKPKRKRCFIANTFNPIAPDRALAVASVAPTCLHRSQSTSLSISPIKRRSRAPTVAHRRAPGRPRGSYRARRPTSTSGRPGHRRPQ